MSMDLNMTDRKMLKTTVLNIKAMNELRIRSEQTPFSFHWVKDIEHHLVTTDPEGWILIEDQLPDHEQPIEVWWQYLVYPGNWNTAEKKWAIRRHGWVVKDGPTHWRPRSHGPRKRTEDP